MISSLSVYAQEMFFFSDCPSPCKLDELRRLQSLFILVWVKDWEYCFKSTLSRILVSPEMLRVNSMLGTPARSMVFHQSGEKNIDGLRVLLTGHILLRPPL